jgi:hypothetical protein
MKSLVLASTFCFLAGTAGHAQADATPGPLAQRVATAGMSGQGERITAASGTVISERRDVSGFSAIHLIGPIDLELKASDREAVTVKADEAVVPLIETSVTGGERPALEIRVKPDASFRASRSPVVVVEFRRLSELVVRGSGKVRADRIDANDFALSMAGSGDVRIAALHANLFGAVLSGSGDLKVGGRADQQAYALSGSGDVAAPRLEGRSVKISISGSGDATVHASESLEVSIAGSGNVIYRGSPRVSQTIRGSGRVRQVH